MSTGVHFSEMEALCCSEASRIEVTQSALAGTEDRGKWHPEQLRKMEVFEAIVHLIDLVRADDVVLNRLRKAAKVPKALVKQQEGSEVSTASPAKGNAGP